MDLPRRGREFYDQTITTAPAVAGWEASFDGGTTYVAGEEVEIDPPVTGALRMRWLVAGPLADPGTAEVISADLVPLLRATDNPELIVRKGPKIRLT